MAKALEQILATSPTELGELFRIALGNIDQDIRRFKDIARSESDRGSAAMPNSSNSYNPEKLDADEIGDADPEKRVRDLLPLPMDVDAAESASPLKLLSAELSEARRAWIRLLVTALNYLYGCRGVAVAGPPSEAQLTCLGRLAQAAQVWHEEMQSQQATGLGRGLEEAPSGLQW